MSSRIKIAGAVAVGLIAGATVMGAALAAPRTLSNQPFVGYRMMGSTVTSATPGIPTIAEMRSFMNRYRTSSRAIDMNRMHSDVTSGKVTPPCLNRTSGTSTSPGAQTAPRGGFGMMGGSY